MAVMDLFTVLEQKLEAFLNQFESQKQAIAELKKNLAAKEQALKEAEVALEKVTREKELVRQRIDKILNRLKILDLGE
jgi:archaellum component FlaC|uniref:Cell division protein ZapB n=1 Tax=Desulfobacca acetoxidans TaxID=60893 RepID=A0A7C5ELX3_9BACT